MELTGCGPRAKLFLKDGDFGFTKAIRPKEFPFPVLQFNLSFYVNGNAVTVFVDLNEGFIVVVQATGVMPANGGVAVALPFVTHGQTQMRPLAFVLGHDVAGQVFF